MKIIAGMTPQILTGMTPTIKADSMKIITEPTVYIVGRPTLHTDLIDFLEDHQTDWESDSTRPAERLAECAGRLCYMSFAKPRPGGNAAYIKHILESGHGSVLEHAVWNFIITGVSRSLTHELVRHRAGFAYSQLSQRYVDESVAEYVEPWVIANDPELHQLWLDAVSHSHCAYVALANKLAEKMTPLAFCEENESWPKNISLEEMSARLQPETRTSVRKAARQAARSVLPNATETKVFVTANARALRHFLEQRGSRFAEPEIRRLANHLLDILVVEAPNIFGDYTRTELPDGTFEIDTPYRKV